MVAGWRVNGRQEAREEAIAVIKGRMMAFWPRMVAMEIEKPVDGSGKYF